MLARSLLRAAPARATARQSLRQNSVRPPHPRRDSHWVVVIRAMALSPCVTGYLDGLLTIDAASLFHILRC